MTDREAANERGPGLSKSGDGEPTAPLDSIDAQLFAYFAPLPAVGSGSAVALPAGVGNYQIEAVRGSGGFGVVYLAWDRVLKRRVALKMLWPELARVPRFRSRFLTEAKAAARLSHPNIVPVHEQGEADGVLYIAARLCEGPTLHTWLAEQGSMPPVDQVARLVRDLARAVHYAHEQGVLHRDLKPANVMLEAIDGGEPMGLELARLRPLIVDFGLAKLADDVEGVQTETGVTLGTAPYMAPEQIRGKGVGRAADIFALGTILYEVLTSRAPFAGESAAETSVRVLTEDPIRPRLLRGAIGADLETVCLKCLAKEPRQRYATAAELADELDRVLEGSPIVARRASLLRQVMSLARRRPVAATALACAAVAILGTIGNLAWTNRALRVMNRQVMEAQSKAVSEARMSHRRLISSLMNQGAEELERGQIERAQDTLDRGGPPTGADDPRGIAWELLRERSFGEIEQFRGAGDEIVAFDLSADGRRLVSGSRTGDVVVWDVPSRRKLWRIGAGTTFLGVWFTGDGRYVLVGRDDSRNEHSPRPVVRNVLIHASNSGERISFIKCDHTIGASLQTTPGGFWLAPIDQQGPIWEEYWSLADPRNPRRIGPRLHRLDGGGPSPDGRMIATQQDGEAILWDAAAWRPIRRGRLPAGDVIQCINNEGVALVARSAHDGESRSVYDWSFHGGEVPSNPPIYGLFALIHPLRSFAIHTSVWVRSDGAVMLVDLDQGSALPLFEIDPKDAWGLHWSLTHDGKWLATAFSADPLHRMPVTIWDVASGRKAGEYPGELDHTVVDLAFSPDGRTLYLNGKSTIRAWRFMEDDEQERVIRVSSDEVWSVAFSPDGRVMATGSDDGHSAATVALWDAARGERVGGWEGGVGTVTGLVFSADGKRLAAAGLAGAETGGVASWRLGERGLTGGSGWVAPPLGRMRSLAMSPDGKTLAVGADSGGILVCDTADGSVGRRLVGHRGRVRSMAFRSDGKVLASAAHDGTARLWDVVSGREIEPIAMPSNIVAEVDWGPDGRLWVMTEGGECLAWDGETKSASRFAFGAGRFRAMAISPDGKTVAAGGESGVVSLRDPVIGEELLELEVGEQVNDLAFAPDGKTLAAACHDGTVRVWSVGNAGVDQLASDRSQGRER